MPDYQFRLWTRKSRTVDDENGIHLVDPDTKMKLSIPQATADDLFPGFTCEDLIDAILEWECPVPVFSTTRDLVWWLHFALRQYGRRHIGPDDTVRITVIKPISSLGSELLEVDALDALGEMCRYRQVNIEAYIAAMYFARASSQHLHRDIGHEFTVWTHEFGKYRFSCVR